MTSRFLFCVNEIKYIIIIGITIIFITIIIIACFVCFTFKSYLTQHPCDPLLKVENSKQYGSHKHYRISLEERCEVKIFSDVKLIYYSQRRSLHCFVAYCSIFFNTVLLSLNISFLGSNNLAGMHFFLTLQTIHFQCMIERALLIK